MSIFTGLLCKQKGSVGQLTFRRVNGQTVISEKVTEVSNPQTEAQMKQRTKWLNLDASNDDKLWDKVNKYGFYSQDGCLDHGPTEGDFCYCWVHSRKSDNKTLVSSQSLIASNSKLADYTSDSAYTAASGSYGTTSTVFLTPSGDSESGVTSGGSSTDTGDDGAL